ncbi:MAG: hypothetical protein HKP11_01295 [Flavobacteriaceae bacterium]|nr:hypothetical protein [Flavobacteriaceae bacterium]
MDKMMYLAAQYLAAAGKSFVEHKPDDSHTNLSLSTEHKSLVTRELGENGDRLLLSYEHFSLKWISRDGIEITHLHNTRHAENVKWLNEVSQQRIGKSYVFDLHYDLGYDLHEEFKFELENKEELKDLYQRRVMANNVLTSFLSRHSLRSEIRIWPHHFDTGAFVTDVGIQKLSIGLGMAIPDSMSEHYYFYLSGYNGRDGIDTSSFEQLTRGSWKNEGFKGAILPIAEMKEKDAVQFLDEAMKAYIN